MAADLYKKLLEYKKSGVYPFHMPGHKMGQCFEMGNFFDLDITEIDGFDNLHNPKGIIYEAQKKYARLFGAQETFFSVNGSSGALIAAIMAVCGNGEKIIAARNCHRSVYSAFVLSGAVPVYVMPEYIEGTGIVGGILPSNVKKAVLENPDAKAVIITSPTAEGIVSDIREIARITHEAGMTLIVDEAHGSHFKFCEIFPDTALECGADIVVQSAHKTLPSPTQTSVLHLGMGGKKYFYNIKETLSVIETSSPSYVFMAALDLCRDYIENNGAEDYRKYSFNLTEFRKSLKNLSNMSLLDKNICGKYGIKNIDVSKIVVVSDKADCVKIKGILRKNHNIELEMACRSHFVAISTVCDKPEGFKRLKEAIIDVDKSIKSYKILYTDYKYNVPCLKLSPREAFYHKKRSVGFEECEGMVCGEFVIPYPPGIPIIAPGEIITKKSLDIVKDFYNSGVEITGVKDRFIKKITVLD